jgi:broad specificity phosphatase PhoE
MQSSSVDIFLVRHGEATAGWGEDPDPGLSTLGGEQAVQAAEQMQTHAPLRILSSPLLRARETAQPLAHRLGVEVEVDPIYRELPSPVGIADRREWLTDFMKQEWQEQNQEILEWRNGIWNALFELDRPTVIFTHFMVINAVVGRLTEALETVCCVPDNGSITRLELEGSALKLVEVGRQHKTLVN